MLVPGIPGIFAQYCIWTILPVHTKQGTSTINKLSSSIQQRVHNIRFHLTAKSWLLCTINYHISEDMTSHDPNHSISLQKFNVRKWLLIQVYILHWHRYRQILKNVLCVAQLILRLNYSVICLYYVYRHIMNTGGGQGVHLLLIKLPCLASFGYLIYDTDLVTSDHTVILRWNSAVVSMCLPSGLHLAEIKPADPSSILHVHSGCSNDHT